MPVYKYQCPVCKQFSEALKDRCSSDDDCQLCGDCGAPMKRVISGVGATYKGSGFYSTDYRGSK